MSTTGLLIFLAILIAWFLFMQTKTGKEWFGDKRSMSSQVLNAAIPTLPEKHRYSGWDVLKGALYLLFLLLVVGLWRALSRG